MIDGDYFEYRIVEATTGTLDPCCQDAIDRDDVADAVESCPFCNTDDGLDEFFTFDVPTQTCTRRFDRKVDCYLTTSPIDEPAYTNEEHCIEEDLPTSACCDAKQQGKTGTGLEWACSSVMFPI